MGNELRLAKIRKSYFWIDRFRASFFFISSFLEVNKWHFISGLGTARVTPVKAIRVVVVVEYIPIFLTKIADAQIDSNLGPLVLEANPFVDCATCHNCHFFCPFVWFWFWPLTSSSATSAANKRSSNIERARPSIVVSYPPLPPPSISVTTWLD